MVHYGLDKYEAEKILKEYLDKEPDLKYYIDNDYIEKMVDTLIEGIAKVIEVFKSLNSLLVMRKKS